MRILRRTLLVTAMLVLVAVASPAPVGGSTAYVRTYGSSMEPTFHRGDLAVVRAAGTYRVGDVVAYRSPKLGRVVLHRIVDRDAGAFVFKGDNNAFLDAERLGDEHIIGRLALRVARGGTAIAWASQPVHAIAIAASFGALPMAVRTRRRHAHALSTTRGIPMRPTMINHLRTASRTMAAAGVAVAGVGAFAMTRPATEVVGAPVALTQTGSFTYSAPSSSTQYTDGFATGDVVFTRLADRVTVAYAHTVEGDAAALLEGTIAVDVIVSAPTGWERTVPLVEPRPLRDTVVHAVLDLDVLHALAAETAATTGTPVGAVHVVVTPRVDLAGDVAGAPVAFRFEPSLAFTLDTTALRLTTPAPGDAEPITEVREDTVAATASRATVLPLPLPGPDISVSAARTAGLVGGGGLLAIAGALAQARRRRGGGEAARIAARYGNLLVPIRGPVGQQHRAVVDVTTIVDLVRVAKHHDQLVHHHCADDRDTYLVEAQGTTYRYARGVV